MSTKVLGSIAPPSALGHTRGRFPTGVNGPDGDDEAATPMHCKAGLPLAITTYMR